MQTYPVTREQLTGAVETAIRESKLPTKFAKRIRESIAEATQVAVGRFHTKDGARCPASLAGLMSGSETGSSDRDDSIYAFALAFDDAADALVPRTETPFPVLEVTD